MASVRLIELSAEPLRVPLLEPFVIASGRMDATRAALVHAVLEDSHGRRAEGLGEAAALPPVTHEDLPDLLTTILSAASELRELHVQAMHDLTRPLDKAFVDRPVARAGVEAAILDAWARLADTPLHALLGAPLAATLHTDMTLPIAAPEHMAGLAAGHAARGFDCFKVKVGRDVATDLAALRAVHTAVPGARFRLDANEGFSARDALAVVDRALDLGLQVECFEQPCPRDDWAGMAEVTARSPVPVVADESCRGLHDVEQIIAGRAAHAVNLKLAKLGGPLAALAVGQRARQAGLELMAGAMVETRLGLVTMAHVVAALGGVAWVDLDTAFLLAEDPFADGWHAEGPQLRLTQPIRRQP
jgi:L-alanine-DL-glutamate epimerase-like enolase superfamily enzyme